MISHRRLTTRGVLGALAAVSLVAGLIVGVRVLDLSNGTTPAVSSDPSILHEGEVLELTQRGTTVAVDTSTGVQRALARCTGCACMRQFAPSAGGRWIAYDAIVCLAECGDVEPDAGIWVVGAVGPPIHATTDYFPSKFHWSPTAQQLAFVIRGGNGSKLVLFDPETGGRTSIVVTEGVIPSFAWSPDGSTIAYSADRPSEPSGIVVVRPGASPERIGGPSIEHSCCVSVIIDGSDDLVWSPDGTRLAVSTPRDGLTIMQIDGSGERRVLDGQPRPVAWSPDGTRIAYVEGDVIGIVSATGGAPGQLGRVKGRPSYLVWSPDGTLVAFANGFAFTTGRDWNARPTDGTGTIQRVDRFEVERWIQG